MIPRARLLLFAFGDFAFNLYWQSIMLFLLFYYTDALALPVETAAAIYAAATIWDGIINFLVGTWADRRPVRSGGGRLIALGSVPLGLTCILTYMPPPLPGSGAIALVLGGHLLFRTAYAAVNVPYLAMTARISSDSGDRAFVAGARMIFGTLAWVTVARGTIPLGTWLTGSGSAHAYLGAAILFAMIATGILVLVGTTYREQVHAASAPPTSLRQTVASLFSNRAFMTLNLAMMATLVAVTLLNKSVLYYFKYFLHSEAAGTAALGWMGVVSGLAVALWMFLQRRVGARNLWFTAIGLCSLGLALFAAFPFDHVAEMQIWLVAMQAVIVGLHFAFWAMLPNTIEFGERSTGLRVEGAVFGLAALLQRVAIGIATGILGLGFGAAGYVANTTQSAATLASMHWTIAVVPFLFFALAFFSMLGNPLRHGAHARLVREMRALEK